MAARRDRLDGFGAGALFSVALLLAVNQIVVKLVNEGLQPVFFAGLRSALAIVFVSLWMWSRGRPPVIRRAEVPAGLLIGLMFSAEFLFLFLAIDLTTVGRAAVIFYSMPVWFSIAAHFGLAGERLTPIRALGLAFAFAGTAIAILSRQSGAGPQGSLAGDLCALAGAFGWAATAYVARASRLSMAGAEVQLFWMVLVSTPVLLLAAPFFGPLVRDFQPLHLVGLVFQASVVVTGGFIAWLWLLSVYPAATVASFSFLTPLLSVCLGWLLFGESLSLAFLMAAGMVAAGIVLLNRRSP